ncbi:helix-turn-helix transcriptional regulator, partial [Mycetocola sp.]|uniref:helix-turn-helix transcriptional regulator n=1 Tax=Mycetocola sp. TaxID=1871042 RepID=UPI003989A852
LAEMALMGDKTDLGLQHATAVLDVLTELRLSTDRAGTVSIDVDELETIAVSMRALAGWQAGQADTGQARLNELITEAQSSTLLPRHAILLLTRGYLHRQQRRLTEAIADLEAGLTLADHGRPELSVYGRIELALAQFRSGQWDAAAATAAAAASISDDVENAGARASAYAVAAFVPAARGDRQTAENWLADAAAMPVPFVNNGYRRLADVAHALLAKAAGDFATAASIAREAIAHEPMRAQIERDWWQELLVEALGPADPPAVDPLAVLSSREREVAHLAAQGLTNREVAGKLFVSVKGVEYHMGNVLAKLGLSSRRGIRAVLERN